MGNLLELLDSELAGVVMAITAALLAVFCWFWFWVITNRRFFWEKFTEKENDFWVRRGLLSQEVAERIKQLERGTGMVFTVGSFAVIATIAFFAILLLEWRIGRLPLIFYF